MLKSVQNQPAVLDEGDDMNKNAAERIRRYMERHGLSQERFGRVAGIPQTTVGNILRGGTVGASVALRLAPFFGVKPETLMK